MQNRMKVTMLMSRHESTFCCISLIGFEITVLGRSEEWKIGNFQSLVVYFINVIIKINFKWRSTKYMVRYYFRVLKRPRMSRNDSMVLFCQINNIFSRSYRKRKAVFFDAPDTGDLLWCPLKATFDDLWSKNFLKKDVLRTTFRSLVYEKELFLYEFLELVCRC